jgi:predicted CXXCH cytochrome family protein
MTSMTHRPRRPLLLLAVGILAGSLLFPSSLPAETKCEIYLPRNGAYTTGRTIPVMGLVRTDLSGGDNASTVTVTVNSQRTDTFKIRDGWYFSGEVYIEDGVNRITAGGHTVTIMAGDDKTPPKGYSLQYGHTSVEDGCGECHRMEANEQGVATLQLVEPTETLCNWCHYQTGNPKKKEGPLSTHPPAKEGKCLACHTPHADTRPRLLKAEPAKLCPTCHQKLYEDLKVKPYVHGPLNVGSCDTCHVNHASPQPFLLKAPEPDVCASCHGGMDLFTKPKVVGASTHLGIKQGTCHDCHSGHSSNNPKLMKKIVNNLCIDCHPEKTHNFHEEKGFSIYICGRCHDIHNPDTSHLVVNESKKLCETCHPMVGSGEFVHKVLLDKNCFECHGFHEAPYGKTQSETCYRCHAPDEGFLAKHPVQMTPAVRCTTCHSPHRSKNANLTYPVSHRPFQERKCADCHDWLDKIRAEGREPGPNELCYRCHPNKALPEDSAGLVIHKPFGRENCSSCHLTHNSANPWLLTTGVNDLCGRCHSFVKKLQTLTPASIHSAVKEGRCDECHDTHVGRHQKLLRKEPRELCAGCHRKVLLDEDGQPFPVTHRGMEGGCDACHAGHSSRYPSLLKDRGAGSCRKCHPAFIAGLEMPLGSVHEPARKGTCGKCHAVHGGKSGKLLIRSGNALCLTCHTKRLKTTHHNYQADRETFAGGAMSGRKVECLDCHTSHSSPGATLLKDKESPICKGCHTF